MNYNLELSIKKINKYTKEIRSSLRLVFVKLNAYLLAKSKDPLNLQGIFSLI
jgi:hypothetical protein